MNGRFFRILIAVSSIASAVAGCKGRRSEDRIATRMAALTTPSLQVLYKNGDAAAPNDNQLKPFFKLKNNGTSSVALSGLTLRYWYTIESGSAEQVWVDFAQMGNSNVSGRVVRPSIPRSAADRYLEVSFSAAAGSVAAGATSGEIQMRVNKTDWTTYAEANDYSYQATTSYVTSTKVTIYWNGMLVAGTEPAPFRDCDVGVRARALYKSGDRTLPNDNHVKPHLQLVNTGLADIPLKDVKIRYWFTREGTSPEQAVVDYAQIGASKITTTFVSPPVSVASADRYLEVGFTNTAGVLLAGASTGEIQIRFNKTDWSNFTESNDASYDGTPTDYQPAMKVTVHRSGLLLWGQEPTLSAPIPNQSVLVAATLTRNPNGSTTSMPGSQTFSSQVPFSLPQTLAVSEGNLANQTASMVLTTTAGTVTCTYRGGSGVATPTTADDIAKGRVGLFAGCNSACPSAGDIVFITAISLSVGGSDPAQTRTTVTIHQPSTNEPSTPPIPIPESNPDFRVVGDAVPPAEPDGLSENQPDVLPPLPPDTLAVFTTNPLELGHVDTVDPNIIILE